MIVYHIEQGERTMLDFLIGMAAGHLLTQSGGGNTAERLLEQAQTKVIAFSMYGLGYMYHLFSGGEE